MDWATVKDICLVAGPAVSSFVTYKVMAKKAASEVGKIDVETFIAMRGEIKKMSSDLTQLSDKSRDQDKRIGELQSEHKSCHTVLGQVEKNQRIFFDELGIAYWEADKDGNCTYANQTFLDLTGLTTERCMNCGWFDGIHAEDKAKVIYRWKSFIQNTDTQIQIKFRFFHCDTKAETEVLVHGQAIYINGFEIHKYTARTKPITRS